jgi:hypothetical protein
MRRRFAGNYIETLFAQKCEFTSNLSARDFQMSPKGQAIEGELGERANSSGRNDRPAFRGHGVPSLRPARARVENHGDGRVSRSNGLSTCASVWRFRRISPRSETASHLMLPIEIASQMLVPFGVKSPKFGLLLRGGEPV